jgi:arginine decarboxylase
MIFKMPNQYFLTCGASDGYTPLNAFDGALLHAGIGNTNIVKMSSIVPPHCTMVDPIALPPGALVPAAYAAITSDVPGEIISAGVALALPEDENQNGLIMEYSAKGERRQIEETVRTMAVEGMMLRGWEIKDLKSIAIEHTVGKIGSALAAVVLWDSEEAIGA